MYFNEILQNLQNIYVYCPMVGRFFHSAYFSYAHLTPIPSPNGDWSDNYDMIQECRSSREEINVVTHKQNITIAPI